MPLLYGEGERAFQRLQEHIAASSTDHSLFAWGVPATKAVRNELRSYRSIFARSPADFSRSRTMVERIVVHPDAWTQINRGLHGVFPTIPAPVAKDIFEVSESIDDGDYLILLNCQPFIDLEPLRNLAGWVAGIWVSLIDIRDDGKHGFCRVTDIFTFGPLDDVHKLLGTSPKKFREDLWLATTPSMLRVPRDHVSARLAGFLVHTVTSGPVDKVRFKFHGVYGHKFRGKMHIVPCPYLPTARYEGLIGVVTVKVAAEIYGVDYKETAAVLFGFPSNSTKPFAKVVDARKDERGVEAKLHQSETPLDIAVRKFIEPKVLNNNRFEPWDYRCKLFNIDLTLSTVLHNNMVFMELQIELFPWLYGRRYRETSSS